MQVRKQTAVRHVKHGTNHIAISGKRTKRLIPVNVPGGLIEYRLEHVYGHEANATFHQPARPQAVLSESICPISPSGIVCLAREIESPAHSEFSVVAGYKGLMFA